MVTRISNIEGNTYDFSNLKDYLCNTSPSVIYTKGGLEGYITSNLIFDPFLRIIEDRIREGIPEAEKFFRTYLSCGNFLMVPELFNTKRSHYGKDDTADYMLWQIYQYFTDKCPDDEKCCYLSSLFQNSREAVDNCLEWFNQMDVKTWEDFVTVQKLESFIDPDAGKDWNERRPLSFKTGNPIDDNSLTNGKYSPLPNLKCQTEFQTFFKTATTAIHGRTDAIRKVIGI